MAIHRYWRIIGIQTSSNADLELSEFRFYNLGALADTACTITSTIAPFSGNLSYLTDNNFTNVVTWDYSSWSQSGFSIKYDFGSGQGVEYPKFRIGSGSSQSTWIIDCVSQWSDDNINWTGYFGLNNIHYPGAYSLTTLPDSGTPDIYYSNVSLLINSNGVNGSTTIVDNSVINQKTISVFGNAQISTTQSKYGGSSVYFGGAGYLSIPDNNDFAFGSGDYTLETWAYVSAPITSNQVIMGQWGTGVLGWNMLFLSSNRIAIETSTTGVYEASRDYVSANNVFSNNVWFHVAITRYGNVYSIWVNGVLLGLLTVAGTLIDSTSIITIGAANNTTNYFTGYLDDLRITKGVARYTSNFTPIELSIYPIALDTYTARLTKLISLPNRILPEVELPNGSGVQSQKEYIFNDVYYGGSGIISGTTKIKNTLSNIPAMKRVVLIDERSKLVIAERWSDSTTGYFEFKGFRTDILYTLLSYDHTGAFNAVVAVSVTPTIIS